MQLSKGLFLVGVASIWCGHASMAQSCIGSGSATRVGNTMFFSGPGGSGSATRVGSSVFFNGPMGCSSATRVGDSIFYRGF